MITKIISYVNHLISSLVLLLLASLLLILLWKMPDIDYHG